MNGPYARRECRSTQRTRRVSRISRPSKAPRRRLCRANREGIYTSVWKVRGSPRAATRINDSFLEETWTMTKKPGLVWTYYNKKVDGTQTIAFCKYCNQSYIQNATRMEKHLVRCEKCPESVKETFAKHRKEPAVARAGRTSAWIDGKNVGVDDATDEWERTYEEGNVDFEITEDADVTSEGQGSARRVLGNDASIAADVEWETVDVKRSESPSPRVSESQERASVPQERGSASHSRRPTLTRRISQWPGFSPRTAASHSPLQSKILQEQLLERRIWRRVAELELRKKNLELERLQWEYERDKMQSELKFGHEGRMMELREEREKQILEREMADG